MPAGSELSESASIHAPAQEATGTQAFTVVKPNSPYAPNRTSIDGEIAPNL